MRNDFNQVTRVHIRHLNISEDAKESSGNPSKHETIEARSRNLKSNLAPSKILYENELEMRAYSVFLNKLSFDSKSTLEYCIKLRND
jgi:hypothetical protein